MLTGRGWTRRKHEWLPAPADKEFLLSIMNAPIYEPGRFANYIAPPARGVKGKPINFEYVRTGDRKSTGSGVCRRVLIRDVTTACAS